MHGLQTSYTVRTFNFYILVHFSGLLNERLIIMNCTVKPVLSDLVWALKKWSLNTGGLLIKGACIVWLSFGTSGSGRSRQVVTEYKWSQDRFHCIAKDLLLYANMHFTAVRGLNTKSTVA